MLEDRDYAKEFKTLQQVYDESLKNQRYSIEKHGDGYALYFGRSAFHHGLNIAHITECTQETRDMIVKALNNLERDVI